MYANKDCIFLLVLDGDSVVERNKHVRVSSHHGLYLRLAQLVVETLGYIEGDVLFWRTRATKRAAIFSAVSRIHDYSGKRFARVFDTVSPHRAARR
jgi:hypothetical protein